MERSWDQLTDLWQEFQDKASLLSVVEDRVESEQQIFDAEKEVFKVRLGTLENGQIKKKQRMRERYNNLEAGVTECVASLEDSLGRELAQL